MSGQVTSHKRLHSAVNFVNKIPKTYVRGAMAPFNLNETKIAQKDISMSPRRPCPGKSQQVPETMPKLS